MTECVCENKDSHSIIEYVHESLSNSGYPCSVSPAINSWYDFTEDDLVSGMLILAPGMTYKNVRVYNDKGDFLVPDIVPVDGIFGIDLNTLGTISGVWRISWDSASPMGCVVSHLMSMPLLQILMSVEGIMLRLHIMAGYPVRESVEDIHLSKPDSLDTAMYKFRIWHDVLCGKNEIQK